jgi:hypothetical protein
MVAGQVQISLLCSSCPAPWRSGALATGVRLNALRELLLEPDVVPSAVSRAGFALHTVPNTDVECRWALLETKSTSTDRELNAPNFLVANHFIPPDTLLGRELFISFLKNNLSNWF